MIEKLWRELFSNPSEWWDHRAEKGNPRYPDFKHKKTQQGLWLNGKLKPLWVEAELATMPSGTLQSSLFSWNARLARYVQIGKYEETMELYKQMRQEGMNPNRFTFVPVLHACTSIGALEEGRRIHTEIIEKGFDSDVYIGASLVGMYAKCGRLEDAQIIFKSIPTHNVVSWNAMIMGHVKCGQGQIALELFEEMQWKGVEPDRTTFVGLLNACASLRALEVGQRIHQQIIQRGCEPDIFVGSSLVDMYSKCGSIEDAWRVFNKMPARNVVAWSAMVQGYLKCGQGQKALELSKKMQSEGVEPDPIMLVGFLNACASVGALGEGRRVHEQILQRGWENNVFLGSSLVDMYAKCGSIKEARKIFNQMPTRNVVAWSAMIYGYVKCGQGQKALDLFQKMQLEGVEPDSFTFVGLLNACASVMALEEGRTLNEHIIRRGWESDIIVGSSLVDMYAKCGSIEDAWTVLQKMPTRNVVTWTAMIQGYVKLGEGHKALETYKQMQQEGVEPNIVTFVGLLNACASVEALEDGRRVHEQIIQRALESDAFVVSSLIDMYAKCGSIEDARRVFKEMPTHDVVSWNTIIQGHVKDGQGQEALELFQQMQLKGVEPDSVTFVAVVNACGSQAALEEGKLIHQQIVQKGLESDVFLGNSLIGMYTKCGSIEDAWTVFIKMHTHTVVSWNAIIAGLVKFGKGEKALELFEKMQHESVEPDSITFVSFLSACASVVALEEGRRFHERIIKRGLESDVFVCSSLVDMYAKCGCIDDARRVFNKLSTSDVVYWNTMLGGYAMHGYARDALGLFERMCQEGVDIDRVTFVSLLSAFSHAGLVDEGMHYFDSMNSVYCISATMENYACVVDLLSRAGHLHNAENVIETMSCKPDATLWMSLLSACRVHGNVEMAEQIARKVLELDPGNSAGYLLLSNVYAAAGNWDMKENVHDR